MKKLILTITMLVIAFSVTSQNSTVDNFTANGISTFNQNSNFNANAYYNANVIFSDDSEWIVSPPSSSDQGKLRFTPQNTGSGSYWNWDKSLYFTNDGGALFSGNVGIGIENPDSPLTVNGKIHCSEVQVDLDFPGPDYVFEKYYTGASELKEDYTMPTLEEVEAFTKENHHLPNIPSAKEIQEEGLHLKEMTNLLLQKVEELTLYTIEQEKRIKTLEGKLAMKK